jgi:glycosyltransferase involved in cell wall biosynthesis
VKNNVRISSFAPLAPARSGVADYAAALLAELRLSGAIAENAGDCDLAIYHLGNNELHGEIYARALAYPGVVVLHDAVLTHFLLGALDENAWINEFTYNYGEWSRSFAHELWANRARAGADPRYFAYPMLRRLAETSRAVIVHNPAAARAVARHAPHARVAEIPHFFLPHSPEARPTQNTKLRAGVFGYLRESKRLPSILRAVERTGGEVELVIAGAFVSSDLQRALAPRLESLTYIGYLSEEDFWRCAHSVDVCINLRYPTAHETSGIGVRLMGLGKCVIFTESEEIARLPEAACLRVEHGPAEEKQLQEYLIWLARNREAVREIGQRAAAHIAREHNVKQVARAYWDVLKAMY